VRISGWEGLALAAALVTVAGCDDGRASLMPGYHTVTIAWQANHEKGVTAPGGGYRLIIGGRPPLDFPYPSPTSLTTTLLTGWYGVSVQAYQPDPEGAGTSWSPASSMTLVVP
jgi:hypothetical protein